MTTNEHSVHVEDCLAEELARASGAQLLGQCSCRCSAALWGAKSCCSRLAGGERSVLARKAACQCVRVQAHRMGRGARLEGEAHGGSRRHERLQIGPGAALKRGEQQWHRRGKGGQLTQTVWWRGRGPSWPWVRAWWPASRARACIRLGMAAHDRQLSPPPAPCPLQQRMPLRMQHCMLAPLLPSGQGGPAAQGHQPWHLVAQCAGR
jgi:hypothetical protein